MTKKVQSANQLTVDWKMNGLADESHFRVPNLEIDEELVTRYQRDGAVLLQNVFTEWIDTLSRGLQINMDNSDQYAFPCDSTPEDAPGRYFDSYCNWLLIPEYYHFVTRSCAASIAGQLMQSSEVQFFHEHVFCKDPGTQHATPWHQDMPYYCLEGNQTVSLYIALDQMSAEVALRFVRGSHQWKKLYHPVSFFDGATFDSKGDPFDLVPDIEGSPEKYAILNWDLEPGDCIAFHFASIHGTTDGEVKSQRRAIATRWFGEDVRYCDRPVETSPPYPDIGLAAGDRMREDWFPVVWRSC